MVICTNQLKGSYQKYQCRQVRIACQEIPRNRKEDLRDEIIARVNLIGCTNTLAYQTALTYLK